MRVLVCDASMNALLAIEVKRLIDLFALGPEAPYSAIVSARTSSAWALAIRSRRTLLGT